MKAITSARKYDLPLARVFTLQWLPVKTRAEYKGLIHRAVRFNWLSVAILLRSDFRAQFVNAGERSINHILPKLWNSMPPNLAMIEILLLLK